MKRLEENKEFFKDVFMDWLQYNDEVTQVRYRTVTDTLEWIYGEEFRNIEAGWRQEALNEFYTMAARETARN